jgi:ribosomal protein L40E
MDQSSIAGLVILSVGAIVFLLIIRGDRKALKAQEEAEARQRAEARAGQVQPETAVSTGTGFAILGGLAGATVGYLIGSPPNLPFMHVITRGTALHGLDGLLLRPSAEMAFNYMLAGAVVGILGGIVVAYLASNRSATESPKSQASQPRCSKCGADLPVGMSFCGKCGASVGVAVCEKCGKSVPADQDFCGSCGTRARGVSAS